jgi:predicted GNAT superfamily acetyltransferase
MSSSAIQPVADPPVVAVAAEVRTLNGMDDLNAAMEVLRAVWGFPDGEAPISAELMRAVAFAGGYVAGAFADGQMIGASAGFMGERDGHVHLHSHITGVVPGRQSRHVGLALKHHQRDWALHRGITVIEWTFDPLVRRNAFFNLVKLGAAVVGFEPNFYGDMHDAINTGDPTDRAIVRWDLGTAAGNGEEPDETNDAPPILRADDAGRPVVAGGSGPLLRAWVPEDIVALRRADPEAGRAWRVALRESFGAAVADGYVARSMNRDGWYTLARVDSA